MNQEGVIKFNPIWHRKPPLDNALISDLNDCRQQLYHLHLIGCTDDGIGYGNISKRYDKDLFIISGSGSGNIPVTTNEHYTLVSSFDIEGNSLTAEGPVMASSESLTHAMLYKTNPAINSVIHVHHHALWNHLVKNLPYTSIDVEYGTPAMAMEIRKLISDPVIQLNRIFAMGGHADGIIAFGEGPSDAATVIINWLKSS